MTINAKIDQIGRESFTTNNPKADLGALGREAWLSISPHAHLDALGREAWIPVAAASALRQPNLCINT